VRGHHLDYRQHEGKDAAPGWWWWWLGNADAEASPLRRGRVVLKGLANHRALAVSKKMMEQDFERV